MKKRLLAVLVILSLSGCGNSSAPVKVAIGGRIDFWTDVHYTEVKVTATADAVTVENIVVNRGNCGIDNRSVAIHGDIASIVKALPKKLTFGQTVAVDVVGLCNVSEVTVVTNRGRWTYEF
ncbi:MAG: hypothetical protein P8011_15705 [Acidihalobacter sp.]|uniref:hypothetical protein n=1 Tax=Acidihalobacter sp. TaxID=1872108 RepID=UPI00307E00F0